MMKQFLALAALTAAAHWPVLALAHGGATPRHGGVVQMVSDLSFELVTQAGGVALYVEDHGKPMAPTGISGKLTVLSGGQKSEAVLAVAGDRLEAKGVQLASGSKVVAVLTTARAKTITVRFVVK